MYYHRGWEEAMYECIGVAGVPSLETVAKLPLQASENAHDQHDRG